MSAICGFINLNNAEASCEISNAMMSKLERYPSDYSDTFQYENCFLGCLFKAITPEAEYEKLPYYDEQAGMVITADAIIDNRLELFKAFDIPSSEWDEFPDSMLILMAYQEWGEKCPCYLIGDYCFAIFDKRTRELFCARDHTGNRTFYYYHTSEIFVFSTAIEPLFCIDNCEKRLNDEWISDFLSLPGPVHEVDCTSTVYRSIMQLPPAHHLLVNGCSLKIERYWYPVTKNELKLKSDADYEEAFREVLFEAVKCRLRAKGDIGIKLSGGLDSGSVASVAATLLNEQNKRLNAYCAVPFSGYIDYLPKRLIADESPYVNAICEKYSNIDIKYVQSENKNSISEVDKLLNVYEQPYKTVENAYWGNEISCIAAHDGCSVMLSGQLGNVTISYGNIQTYLNCLLMSGRLMEFAKEVNGYCGLYKVKRYSFLKRYFKDITPDWVLDARYMLKGIKKGDTLHVPVNPGLAKMYDTEQKLRRLNLTKSIKLTGINYERSFGIHARFLSQIAMFETKTSLYYGIQQRDPTSDKRVVDFCFSVPVSQYVRNGHERYLLRRSLEGILPDKVRLNYTTRGYQSADWIQRLVPSWDSFINELKNLMDMDCFAYYTNMPLIIEILRDAYPSSGMRYRREIRMLVICFILGNFLKSIDT